MVNIIYLKRLLDYRLIETLDALLKHTAHLLMLLHEEVDEEEEKKKKKKKKKAKF
jgi:chemotaxis methyl-accepting protein methylase